MSFRVQSTAIRQGQVGRWGDALSPWRRRTSTSPASLALPAKDMTTLQDKSLPDSLLAALHECRRGLKSQSLANWTPVQSLE